jgi:hypothetical protein
MTNCLSDASTETLFIALVFCCKVASESKTLLQTLSQVLARWVNLAKDRL